MNGHAIDLNHAANVLAEPATWEPVRPAEEQPEDWNGLERMEQVVARQRRYTVRDIVAAVGFAVLAIAVVVALL
jgi:hypothetical protein